MDSNGVVISVDQYDFVNDDIIMFSDHEACWDLECRGAVGETVLHLCYLNNTPIHIEIAKVLLDLYPKLSLDIYEAEEYYGESFLHAYFIYSWDVRCLGQRLGSAFSDLNICEDDNKQT